MTKNVLLTGHSGGIGKAIAHHLMTNGYVVAAIDIKPGGTCNYELIHDLEDCSHHAEETIANFLSRNLSGQLDALINCAALQITGSLDSLTVHDLQRSFNVNTLAPFFLTQICKELFTTHATILNIGSIHSRLTKPEFLPDSVSKSALSGLSRSLALSLGSELRVIEIQPAAIATDMLEEGFEDSPEARAKLDSYHPTGQIGTPEEVALLCASILSNPLPFLNGSVINLDGGISHALHDPG